MNGPAFREPLIVVLLPCEKVQYFFLFLLLSFPDFSLLLTVVFFFCCHMRLYIVNMGR